MKLLLFFFFYLCFSYLSWAQNNFIVKNGSANYTADITVENCNDDICSGNATIKLFDKKSTRQFQTLHSNDLYFFLDQNQKPTVNIIEIYNEQSPLIFNDFNFDGTEDIAIRNGNNSSYGGPSYDIYVFNITKKQFVLSEELTSLATDNLGMFQTDSVRERLITFSKDGCCWHITKEYEVVPKKGLVKVYELEEDSFGGDSVVVIKRELINNNWKETVKKFKIEDYYKD